MNRRIGLGATLFAAVSMIATGAAATKLDTSVLGTVNAGDHVVCNILNIGPKPIEALIQLRDPVGGGVLKQATETVDPSTRERVVTDVQTAGVTNFYCHFEFKGSKKKVRANLSIGDDATDVTTSEAR